MDTLNKYHKSKSQVFKFKCEKTNKELTNESFQYDNCPSEFVPLLINAINELKERIGVLENKITEKSISDTSAISSMSSGTSLKQKKPLNL